MYFVHRHLRMIQLGIGIAAFILIVLPHNLLGAWPGHDWDKWRKLTHAQPPEFNHRPQAGRKSLYPLLSADEDESKKIEGIRDWERKRDAILEAFGAFIGEPTDLVKPPLEVRFVETSENLPVLHPAGGAPTMKKIRIRSEPDDWIPAWLIMPNPPPTRPSRAMIVIHQTVSQGKDEPAGIDGGEELAFARELAELGFICLVPDMIGFGERTPEGAQPYADAEDFFRRHPDWSFFGKMAWDISRCVDYLESLPEVDPHRIGSIGHSHGAYATIVSMMLDPRISVGVASCGFTTLRSDPTPDRWSHLTALLPSLGFYVEEIDRVPFDWHELLACLAPRPFFNWATDEDGVFPNTDDFPAIYDEVRDVYGLYGAMDCFQGRLAPGPHRFPKGAREEAYRFLVEQMPLRPAPWSEQDAGNELAQAAEEMRLLIEHDIGIVRGSAGSAEPRIEHLSHEDRGDYIEYKIQYRADAPEPIPAYLLIPKIAAPLRRPGVVIFHQTVPEGKDEVAGLMGRRELHLGPELVRRGYVVLAPDSICAGERIDEAGAYDTREFYQREPNLSAMGRMVRDGIRAVDMLSSRPEVDPSRIAVMGHSLGAEEALFVSAFDPRVRAAIGSCGFAPFSAEKQLDRWARDHWFSYMPRLRGELRAGRRPAWDFDDVVALVYPRSYFHFAAMDDDIFPEAGAMESKLEAIEPIWDRGEGTLAWRFEPGPHSFSATGKATAYEWLDRVLDWEKP